MKTRILSIVIASVMILSLTISSLTVLSEDALPFKDVIEKDWFYDSVYYVYTDGIMTGTSDDTFEPGSKTSRAMVVTVLYRIENEPAVSETSPFTDLKQSWYIPAVSWAYKYEIVKGMTATTFTPSGNITREQMAAILYRYSQYKGYDVSASNDLSSYKDADEVSDWAKEAMMWANGTGLITGMSETILSPKGDSTRAQLATILERYIEYYAEVPEELSADGTELTYTGEMTEDAFSAWLPGAAGAPSYTLVSGYDAVAADYSVYNAKRTVKTTSSFGFKDQNGENISRTYTIYCQGTDTEDATPDNTGIMYEENGASLSYLTRFATYENDVLTPLPVGTNNAIHGGHQTRIVRTDNGTYAVVITNETFESDDEHPYWVMGVATFSILKVKSDSCEILYATEYPNNQSSLVPYIFSGKDGKVYVVLPADDTEFYWKGILKLQAGKCTEADVKSGAWLGVYVIDTYTDTVEHVAESRYPFDTSVFDDHGYGKPTAVVDWKTRKIYAMFNGAQAPAYIAWFIYDMDTGEWDPQCHTLTIEYRRDYFNAYPDGEGGVVFVIQRVNSLEAASEAQGIVFKQTSGYIWDGIYLYHIKDMEEVTFSNDVEKDRELYGYTEVAVELPQYQGDGYKNTADSISHYGNGGCTYLDDEDHLHIIFKHFVGNIKRTTVYHVIYDLDGNELFREALPSSVVDKNGSRSPDCQGAAMMQGTDGTYYLFMIRDESYMTVEVFSSDDGKTFTSLMSPQEMKTVAGDPVKTGKIVISNTRCNSVCDGIITLMFNTMTDNVHTYYYFTFEEPDAE